MKFSQHSVLLIGMLFVAAGAFCQEEKTLAERLGYPSDAKLLIIHADDMGLSHSTNMACIKAFEQKAINSGSVLVPCPWFPEIASYIKSHPGMDIGIHLALNAEWKFYKWGGVLPSSDIPSLVDKDGYLYASIQEVAENARPEEVEKELRAQISRAIAFGIQPTHIDNHMGSLMVKPEFIRIYLKLARDFNLPATIPINMIRFMAPQLINEIDTNLIMVDNFLSMYSDIAQGDWESIYQDYITNLKPGLNEMIFHLSCDNDEMKAIAADQTDFGSNWRQKDLDFVLSDKFKQLIEDNNIYLVTWGQIQKVMR